MIVPIVFAANEQYVPYLGVALYSLIRHTSAGHEYRIYILHEDVSERNKKRISTMDEANVHIEFVDVTAYSDILDRVRVGHFSRAAAFRLLSAELFPQYEKILYLDSDIIVNWDVAELYRTDIEECILGAALHIPNCEVGNYIVEVLQLPVTDYFNSGVLLINLPLFRQYEIGRKALSMLMREQYLCADQDPLNILCRGKVKYIDRHWNVLWGYLREHYQKSPMVDVSKEEIASYYNNPFILHYTVKKPWENPSIELSDYFWGNVWKIIFWEDILLGNIHNIEKKNRVFFPWKLIIPESRIILYGGGVVGKTFLRQIEMIKYCTVCAVCDRSPSGVEGITVPVIGPDEICRYEYDAVLIAVEKENVAMEIKETLLEKEIPKEKIKWMPPERV